MKTGRYGIELEDGTQLVYISSDRHGRTLLFRGKRQEIEIRVTKTGLIRTSRPRRTGPVTYDGVNS